MAQVERNDGGMKWDMTEDGRRIRRKAEGMKEDELIFNNVMSWKPFSFQPSVAINNRVSEIKWLCVSVRESVCACVSQSFTCACVCLCASVYRDNKRWEVWKGKQRVRGVCVLRTCEH